MQIRAFHPGDEPAVVALWQQCGLTRPWNDPRKGIERKLKVQPELFLQGHRGWVNYLAVAPAFRGRGFGSALMRRVEELLKAMGCPKVTLLIGKRLIHDRRDEEQEGA